MVSAQTDSAGEKETGRVEAFSDGVFAIAIILLVLDLKVPNASAAARLSGQLAKQWPAYLAFVISFSFIGVMWINHHRLFTYIRRTDHALLILNGLLLVGVTVVPFTTSLLAAYLGRQDQEVAMMVYSGTYVVIALAAEAGGGSQGNASQLGPATEQSPRRDILSPSCALS
jgi:uncharacterized membrane protein